MVLPHTEGHISYSLLLCSLLAWVIQDPNSKSKGQTGWTILKRKLSFKYTALVAQWQQPIHALVIADFWTSSTRQRKLPALTFPSPSNTHNEQFLWVFLMTSSETSPLLYDASENTSKLNATTTCSDFKSFYGSCFRKNQQLAPSTKSTTQATSLKVSKSRSETWRFLNTVLPIAKYL